MKIPLFCDVDGTLTDGTVSYPSRERRYHLRDGHSFELLKKHTNIIPHVISGEDDISIVSRFDKLRVSVNVGVPNKYQFVRGVYWINDGYIAISDDIPDMELLEKATIAFCPADAEEEIKNIDGIIVLSRKGGDGCFREAVNMILSDKYIQSKLPNLKVVQQTK